MPECSGSAKPLADAARRLRDVSGFPRRVGRPRKGGSVAVEASAPRKHPANGHDVGHGENGAAQPRDLTSENGHDPRAGVRQTPAVERPAGAVVTVAPRLLSLRDAGLYLGGICKRTVEGYIAAGLLAPVRLPSPRGGRRLGRVLLDREELDRFVAECLSSAGQRT